MNGQIDISQNIKLDLSNVSSIHEVIPILEKKTKYNFAFGNILEDFCGLQVVKLQAPLHDILDEIFTPCNIDWVVIGEHIILTKLADRQMNISLSGRIID